MSTKINDTILKGKSVQILATNTKKCMEQVSKKNLFVENSA